MHVAGKIGATELEEEERKKAQLRESQVALSKKLEELRIQSRSTAREGLMLRHQRAKSVEASKFPNEFKPRPRMRSEGDEAESTFVAKSGKARSKSVTTEQQRPLVTSNDLQRSLPTSDGDAAKNDEDAEPLANVGLSAPSLVRSLASSSATSPPEQQKVWWLCAQILNVFLRECEKLGIVFELHNKACPCLGTEQSGVILRTKEKPYRATLHA